MDNQFSDVNRLQRFSIRKLSVGVASALVGVSLFGLSSQTVQADDFERDNTSLLVQETSNFAVASQDDLATNLELVISDETQLMPTIHLENVNEPEIVSNDFQVIADTTVPTLETGETVIVDAVVSPLEIDEADSLLFSTTLTQAQQYDPEWQHLEVGLGQDFSPAYIIKNRADLPHATRYTWQKMPNINTPGGKLARVFITYPDGSSEDVLSRVVVNRSKTFLPLPVHQPELTLTKFSPSETNLEAELSYELSDLDMTFVSATVSVYHGSEKISEQHLHQSQLNNVLLAFPNWETLYTVETVVTYDEGHLLKTVTLPSQSVEFELKKLEIKDVDSLSLYRHEQGRTVRVTTLDQAPQDVTSYFVRVTSDKFKDMLLPVKSIREEAMVTGGIAYRVTTAVDELVEDTDPSQVSSYQDQFSFHIGKTNTNQGIYTNFNQLIKDMAANPKGDFRLGSDLFADDVALEKDAVSYVTTNFEGRLTGEFGERQFAIYNLKAPLFSVLHGANISHLDLKQVDINRGQPHVGALAKHVIDTTVYDLSVQGSIAGTYNVGGLVDQSNSSSFEQISMVGELKTTSPRVTYELGGIVAQAIDTKINHAHLDVILSVTSDTKDADIGGVIGLSFENTVVENVSVSGQVLGKDGRVGGIVGRAQSTNLKNVVSAAQVTNGNLIYGQKDASVLLTNSYAVEGKATGVTQSEVMLLSSSQVESQINRLGISATLLDSGAESYHRSTDYTTLKKAQLNRAIAYDNIEKLIPFYNKEQIVKYGNMIGEMDRLYTTRLQSVTPMIDNKIISDVYSVKQELNRLMLHYDDGVVDYIAIRYKNDFNNQAISEYEVVGTPLIYTPEQFLSDYETITREVLPELQAVRYTDYIGLEDVTPYLEEDLIDDLVQKAVAYTGRESFYRRSFVRKASIVGYIVALGLMNQSEAEALINGFEAELKAAYRTTDERGQSSQMDRLYLESSFNDIKQQLPEILTKLLSIDKSVNTSGLGVQGHLISHIKQNKEKLLMGLAYINRWYQIDFETINLKDLAIYHQDFYGKSVNTIDWLITLGSRYEDLRASNNLETYQKYLASHTGYNQLSDYLSANRKTFTSYQDDNAWFKETSKAYIVEQDSNEQGVSKVELYPLLATASQGNGILPLLTAREGVFVIATMGSLTYGMYDRYYDDPELSGLSQSDKIEKIKEKINRAAKQQVQHLDTWYRLLPETERQKLLRTIPIWDGYIVNGNLLPKYGNAATSAILDFFGPVGRRSDAISTSRTIAYALGDSVSFFKGKVLSDEGLTTFTHELVHVHNDSYLNGNKPRGGVGVEAYATGLLESGGEGDPTTDWLTVNLIFDYSEHSESENRYVNSSPDRFRTKADLQSYLHGAFDVLYTLDYAEAQVASQLSSQAKTTLYGVIENYFESEDPHHAGNSIRELTVSEAERLTSWDKFVDLNIISRREYELDNYQKNGYYMIYLFSPNYAGLSNNQGAPGDIMFRRMAFELLADKGYDAGFVPYTSDQLGSQASEKAEDWSYREVGLVTDDMVLKQIYGQRYESWSDFKKAMFRERIAKLEQLKPVTITYQGRQERIASYRDIERLMISAMAYDASYDHAYNWTSRVRELRAAIYNAYLRDSQDFMDSIYR